MFTANRIPVRTFFHENRDNAIGVYALSRLSLKIVRMGKDDKNGVLFSEYGVEYLVGGTGMVGDVFARCRSSIFHSVGMRHQIIEERLEILCTSDFETTPCRQKVLCFAEAMVVRSDNDRDTVDGSLGNVVDTHAKTTTDVRHCAVTIDAREEAVAVDDDAFGILRLDFPAQKLAVTRVWPFDFVLDGIQMFRAHNVGSEDKVQGRVGVEVGNDDVFVRSPRTSCHESEVRGVDLLFSLSGTLCEAFNERQGFGGILDVDDAVEAGVADNCGLFYADVRQKFDAFIVLDEEMSDFPKGVCGVFSPPFEEILSFSEDARYTVQWNFVVMKPVNIVAPELIFDENGDFRTCKFHETSCVERSVDGEIGDDVRHLIVFPDLVSRGREEGEQDFILRAFSSQTFHQRSSLLKFPQRGCVEPHNFVAGEDFFAQSAPYSAMTFNHQSGFLMSTECSDAYEQPIC